ncbi:MAG TPA: translocation and assembly module TamB, partial [Erwinia persicina]|nr:translocation and assembly module TamB [Erwinia persicina]
VTAGVRVTGLADEPKVEIFSDPAKSQQEALSYLLRGQGLGASGSDSDALTSALVGLGVAQSGQVVGKIGETFGVSNLALDTAGVGDSQQVQVSGYVLPGLQVKYGVGIFDSLATLTLRYRLMPKLYLEAVSGIDQALDVLYQFEF